MKRWLTFPPGSVLLGLTLAALSATVGIWFVLAWIGRALAPATIIDLEFAWSPERLNTLTGLWGEAGTEAARLSLWVDYLFMPAYALLFGGLTLLTARAAAGVWQNLGLWATALAFVAALWDALENTLLLTALPPASPSALALPVAGSAAALKFGLLAVCLVYLGAAQAARWRTRR